MSLQLRLMEDLENEEIRCFVTDEEGTLLGEAFDIDCLEEADNELRRFVDLLDEEQEAALLYDCDLFESFGIEIDNLYTYLQAQDLLLEDDDDDCHGEDGECCGECEPYDVD